MCLSSSYTLEDYFKDIMRTLDNPTSGRVVSVFRARLSRLPVAAHPALRFDPWLEGYRGYVFGGRAGPSVSVTSLFHELGHAAQFGVQMFRTRATEHGFHFKVPRKFIFNRYCDEPRTGQGTERELETFAYQLHLLRCAGHKVSDEHFMPYCARLMRFMPDWYHIPGEGDEGRAKHCEQRLNEHYHRLERREVVDRLEAWLDATARRLKRQHIPLADLKGYRVPL